SVCAGLLRTSAFPLPTSAVPPTCVDAREFLRAGTRRSLTALLAARRERLPGKRSLRRSGEPGLTCGRASAYHARAAAFALTGAATVRTVSRWVDRRAAAVDAGGYIDRARRRRPAISSGYAPLTSTPS